MAAFVLALAVAAKAQSARVVLSPAPGFTIAWDGNNGGFSNAAFNAPAPVNAALATNGVKSFASSSLQPGGLHDHPSVNDGIYGDSSSWIPDINLNPPDTRRFVGLAFGKTIQISQIAWGRDNGDSTDSACQGTCADRAVGLYTLQITRIANPSTETLESNDAGAGWVTLGTVEFKPGPDTPFFSAHLRHRFDVAEGGQPIAATGLRIKVSDANMAIDEIELNPPPEPSPPIGTFLAIAGALGYSITWDGNEGTFSVPDSPARAPRNRALAASGTRAFASSESGADLHFATNVIDGIYGSARGWTPNFSQPDQAPFIGLDFGALIEIRNVAWSRDNGDTINDPACGGTCQDRSIGTYTLQITRVAKPGKDTPETGLPSTGWATLGEVQYKNAGGVFLPHIRHRFDVAADRGKVVATGLRIKLSDPNMAIDEIEVNVLPALEKDLSSSLVIKAAAPYTIEWDGSEGDFSSPEAGAAAPFHDGLTLKGARAFGSSELGGDHLIEKINDGVYGNSSSWISNRGLGVGTDTNAFIGLGFVDQVGIATLAFGRDNGDAVETACGGTCTDRALGVYTLQITKVFDPGKETPESGSAVTGWETVGTVEFKAPAPPLFNPSRRHVFALSAGGDLIYATGIRLKVSDGAIAIDELEINPEAPLVLPPEEPVHLRISMNSTESITLEWTGGQLESAESVNGTWSAVADAASPLKVSAVSVKEKFFRARR